MRFSDMTMSVLRFQVHWPSIPGSIFPEADQSQIVIPIYLIFLENW